MKKQKVLSVDKLDDKKFLKFYQANYETDGKERKYFFTSRHDEKDLPILTNKIKPTAIEVFTYMKTKADGYKIIMIKEFRSAVGQYYIGFPAGLIEDGEDYETAITREIKEEIGGNVKHIELCQNYPLAICPGLTDEANIFAIAELDSLSDQELEEFEDIEVISTSVETLEKALAENKLNLTLSGYLGSMLLINKLKGEYK